MAAALHREVRRSNRLDVETLVRVRRRGAGAGAGAEILTPFDGLCQAIADGGSLVTDAQVADARATTGSDKGAFEIILAASVGAGLARWDAAARAIDGLADEAR